VRASAVLLPGYASNKNESGFSQAYALPNPQQFQMQLDTLMRLAHLNRQINMA
jgi:hypothetical protein